MAATATASPASAVEVYVAIDPCRVFDNRDNDGGGSDIDDPHPNGLGNVLTVPVVGVSCPGDSVPAGATAISGSVIAVSPSATGFLSVFPEDGGFTGTSLLNFPVTEFANDNGSILTLDDDGELGLAWESNPATPAGTNFSFFVVDVTGYFVELESGTGLVASGNGLAIDEPYQLPQSGCALGEVVTSDGAGGWSCESVPGGGDVTDVFAGTGLNVSVPEGPQPTLSLAPTFSLPQGCGSGEIAVWDGDSWECATLGGGDDGAIVVSHAARHNQLNTSSGTITFGPAGASNPTDVQTTSPAAQRIEILSPETGCVAQRMRVRQVHPTTAAAVTMGAGQQRTFQLLVNGVATAGDLACTILPSDSTCLSTNTAIIASGGQRLSIQATNEGPGTLPTADALITWECVVSP